MPEHTAKRKITQYSLPNAKPSAIQDEIKIKENDLAQKQFMFSDAEEGRGDGIPSIETPDRHGLIDTGEQSKELPKPPYDAMRVEPVLVNLIVEKFEGDVDGNGFIEGDAKIHFVGGHWYAGPVKSKKMNGQGVYSWSDGTMYNGEFSDNCIVGNGVYSWPDGSVYEGEVKNGLRHGSGTYKCGTCPSMYIGEWVNGLRHGKGVLYFDQKCETYYDGEWKYGIKDGFGVHKYKSGNYYQGQWFENMRHGKGEMHWLDKGEEYKGEWVKGVQNGHGKHIWYSKRVAVSQYPIRNEYEGNFLNGERQGFGVFRYASGARYSGYWDKNVKSGKGEFMFKNGSVFKGIFENDHIVDYPNLVPSGMTTPEITESGLPVRLQTPVRHPSFDTGSVDALLDINVREIFIEERFDIERQQVELEEITRIVLRHMTPIKQIYKFYSKLGVYESTDNAYIMVRMQLWRLLKDCMLHTLGPTLIEMDFVDGISETTVDCHDPSTQIYIRDFVNVLLNISYMLFKDDFEDNNCVIAKCMLKMLTNYILPNACTVKGSLFSKSDCTRETLKYLEKCGEIFEFFRSTKSSNDMRKALRIRDFLWMLKDFKLINSSLTVKKFLDAVFNDDQQKLEERSFNLDKNLVFLEFFEALLQCSQHFKSEALKSEDENESVKNTMIEAVDFKSPSLTKDDEESITADTVFEQEKSPVTPSSPDKSVVLPEAGSSNDMEKNEPPQSPSKTSDFTSVGKTSTLGGSRKDPKEAGREGGSVNGGSRNRRRGTFGNGEIDSKLGNIASSKSKGAKEKSGKSGGKSAKKVVIDDSKEKNGTTAASKFISTTVSFDVDQEQERQSVVQLEKVLPTADSSSIKQSVIKQLDGDEGCATYQATTNVQEEEVQVNEESLEQLVDDMHQNSITDTNDNILTDNKPDGSGEDFQSWLHNLQVFFEDHFFPAFELQKDITRAQKTVN